MAHEAMEEIVSTEVAPAVVGALFAALRMKGETPSELAGFVDALARRAITVPVSGELMDTCGTGGDRSGSFNVSTAAAFVVAGAGVRVAKHGNRSVSSQCGSADVLEALGGRLDLDPEQVAACIDTVGFGFCFAPAHHPAFAQVSSIRRELGVRTAWNLLGPLLNPAPITHQLVGVFAPQWVDVVAQALARIGRTRALVVHGDGFDEIALSGPTYIAEVAGPDVRTYVVTPEDLGLPRHERDELLGGTAAENAAIFRQVLAGHPSAHLDLTLAQAGAALYAAGRALDLTSGVDLARSAVTAGAATRTLDAFIEFTGAHHR